MQSRGDSNRSDMPILTIKVPSRWKASVPEIDSGAVDVVCGLGLDGVGSQSFSIDTIWAQERVDMLRVEVIKTEAAWRQEFGHWNRMAIDNFMLQTPWLTSWWEGFGVERELFVLKATRGSETLGYLPLCIKRSLLYGRELMFLGSSQASSDNLTMIHDEGYGVECAMAFAKFLAQADGRNAWDRLNLDGVQMSNPKTDLLHREFEMAGIDLLDKPGPSCWKMDLDGGWDGVLQRASKRTRRLLRSLIRDFVDTGRATSKLP